MSEKNQHLIFLVWRKQILSVQGQIGSACVSSHLKRTIFLVKGQVVLYKLFPSSLVMYLEKFSIQLPKAN